MFISYECTYVDASPGELGPQCAFSVNGSALEAILKAVWTLRPKRLAARVLGHNAVRIRMVSRKYRG